MVAPRTPVPVPVQLIVPLVLVVRLVPVLVHAFRPGTMRALRCVLRDGSCTGTSWMAVALGETASALTYGMASMIW